MPSSPKAVKEDFDLYFTGNESDLLIQKKSNCIYATTGLNFIAKFSASLVLKPVMKDLDEFQVSFLGGFICFSFFFFFLASTQDLLNK